jgi:hypothetical protein
MLTPNSTTARHVTFQTPDGRVKVVRDGARDFALYLDGFYTSSYEFSYQAEHEGGVWLHEQTQELAAILADEAAMRDAALAGVVTIDTAFDFSILPILRTTSCPVWPSTSATITKLVCAGRA